MTSTHKLTINVAALKPPKFYSTLKTKFDLVRKQTETYKLPYATSDYVSKGAKLTVTISGQPSFVKLTGSSNGQYALKMTPQNKDADGKKNTFKVTIKDSYTKLTASYEVTVKVAKLEEPEFTKDLDDKVYTVKLNQRFEETLPDVITLSDPSKIEIALEDEPSYV